MVERIEDLSLPTAVIGRLIKAALPEGVQVSKEARSAIAAAASVFVIYLTSSATSIAQKQNRKTITTVNVTEALRELEFESFVEPLERDLAAYREIMQKKKADKLARASVPTAATPAETNGEAEADAVEEEVEEADDTEVTTAE